MPEEKAVPVNFSLGDDEIESTETADDRWQAPTVPADSGQPSPTHGPVQVQRTRRQPRGPVRMATRLRQRPTTLWGAASCGLVAVLVVGCGARAPMAEPMTRPDTAARSTQPPAVRAGNEGTTVGNTNGTERPFEASGGRLDVTARWAAGQIEIALVSLSGQVFDRATTAAGFTHEVGPTFESFHVADAEAGTWTAQLLGERVAEAGVPVTLDVYQPPGAGQGAGSPEDSSGGSSDGEGPLVRQSVQGRTVSVQVALPSGMTPRRYLWEFGDGAASADASAEHTYQRSGTYLVTVAIRDSRGRWSVASAPATIHIE